MDETNELLGIMYKDTYMATKNLEVLSAFQFDALYDVSASIP